MAKRFPMWQMCKHCDCNVPGDVEDLRNHLGDDHDMWDIPWGEIRDEFNFEPVLRRKSTVKNPVQ